MNIQEDFLEIFAAFIVLAIVVGMIGNNIFTPETSVADIKKLAQEDKSITFSTTLNKASDIHDQKIGRIPGIDPTSGYDANDSGLSRMYFRPEQFVMLAAVDTDVSNSPNIAEGRRTVAVSTTYNPPSKSSNTLEPWGWHIGVDPFPYYLNYQNGMDTLSNKQLTYNSIPNSGLLAQIRSRVLFPNPAFGIQVNGSTLPYGGFNLTVDSSIDPVTKKKSNSVIFVAGRVPSK